ncbi:MAG: Co2+/Mg2+ efflux protein ApaG [Chitinophagaceae bacterium]
MVQATTSGIQITVKTFYQKDISNPLQGEFIFAYQVTIDNQNPFSVQLLSRHWHIFDSLGEYREVEGEGVVGVQPVLAPGEQFQYMSACNLTTEIGRMHGTYTMKNLHNHHDFTVAIPAFDLVMPARWN